MKCKLGESVWALVKYYYKSGKCTASCWYVIYAEKKEEKEWIEENWVKQRMKKLITWQWNRHGILNEWCIWWWHVDGIFWQGNENHSVSFSSSSIDSILISHNEFTICILFSLFIQCFWSFVNMLLPVFYHHQKSLPRKPYMHTLNSYTMNWIFHFVSQSLSQVSEFGLRIAPHNFK